MNPSTTVTAHSSPSTPKVIRYLSYVYTLSFSAIISIVTIVVINTVAALTVAIWKGLRLSHVKIVSFCSTTLSLWFSIFMGHVELFGRLTIVLSGDVFYPNEAALVVCNHRSWMDTMILYSLARQVRMHGDIKFLAKRPLLLVPIFGFSGWILDVVIFIKRQSTSAGRILDRMFSSLTNIHRENWPYWLVNYLEGTRFTKKKRDDALEFAKKRSLKQLINVLQPRTKGFVSTVRALRGNAKAVYDITIGYEEDENLNIVPSFNEFYFTTSISKRIIHVHQRRIPLSEIPDDEQQLRKWVYTLYEQKDELLNRFKQTGSFSDRPLRWNRISILYWVRCQLTLYSIFLIIMYLAYTFIRRYFFQ